MYTMHITKTDYLEYTFCRKNLWLRKHKPELFKDLGLYQNSQDEFCTKNYGDMLSIEALEREISAFTPAKAEEIITVSGKRVTIHKVKRKRNIRM